MIMFSFFKKKEKEVVGLATENCVAYEENDNSYETKIGKVKSHLYEIGNISSLEAINLYQATRLSDIIFKLKKTGLHITTTPETYGKSRYVRYHLNKAIQNEQNN